MQHASSATFEIRRDAESDRGHARRATPPRQRRARRGRPLQLTWAVHLVRIEHATVAIDEAREDLRPADIQSDDEGSGHAAGYHSAPNGRGNQALPGVSRRPQEGQSPPRESDAPLDAALADAPKQRRRRRWGLWIALGLLGSVILFAPGVPSAIARSRAAWTRRTPLSRRPRLGSPHEEARSSPTRRPSSSSERTADARARRVIANRSDSLCCSEPIPASTASRTSRSRGTESRDPRLRDSKINAASQIGAPRSRSRPCLPVSLSTT